MREILFKAKRLDNGEWVYGYVVKCPSAVQIGDYSPWYIRVPPVDPDDSGGVYTVDPATVCQYTGKTDKNGVKIFEGDRMAYHYSDMGEEFDSIGTVKYQGTAFLVEEDDFKTLEEIDETYLENASVIGNINDKDERA